MKQKVLVMIKPDGVKRGLTKEIVKRLKAKGLELAKAEKLKPTKEQMTAIYEAEGNSGGEVELKDLLNYFVGKDVVIMLYEGEDAINQAGLVKGEDKDPAKCSKGSIRRDFMADTLAKAEKEGRLVDNIMHATDTPAETTEEMKIWFPDIPIRTFVIISEFGELNDIAMRLQEEGNEVFMHIPDANYKHIGDGIVQKVEEWWRCIGKNYIWIVDGCERGDLQDWLREKGEAVFGGSRLGDELENNRQSGQSWFKKLGFQQTESKNFTDFDDAISFVKEKKEKTWVVKQNGSAPKSLNYVGHFPNSEDVIFHLEGLKKSWNEADFGAVNFDIMERATGLEVAASAFFNGKEFVKNKEGKIVGYVNFEDKKEADGQTGETVGEMGTTFIGVDESNKLFADILKPDKTIEVLRKVKFRGVFDINAIKTKDGIVALEPTMRPGIPASSYEFITGLDMPTGDLIEIVSKGSNSPVEVNKGVGMVMCVVAKPFPLEGVSEETSLGERLWILEKGEVRDEFTSEQQERIHLYNFQKKDGAYRVATRNGHMLTVTSRGKTISQTREELIQYIKDNIFISGQKYRSDIGVRVEEFYKGKI